MNRAVVIGGTLGAVGGAVGGYMLGRKVDKNAFGELFAIFGALAGGVVVAALTDVSAVSTPTSSTSGT